MLSPCSIIPEFSLVCSLWFSSISCGNYHPLRARPKSWRWMINACPGATCCSTVPWRMEWKNLYSLMTCRMGLTRINHQFLRVEHVLAKFCHFETDSLTIKYGGSSIKHIQMINGIDHKLWVGLSYLKHQNYGDIQIQLISDVWLMVRGLLTCFDYLLAPSLIGISM